MKITIYLKSGSRITQRGLKSWNLKMQGNTVVAMSLGWHRWWVGPRLVVPTIDMSQIEAVVASPTLAGRFKGTLV